MTGCVNLETFPTNINLKSLSEISLCGCTRLKTFPDISRNIKKLDLRDTAIEEVPSSISSWSCLYSLDMSGCRNLNEFPNVPKSIVELELSMTGIQEVPPLIHNLSHQATLDSLTINLTPKPLPSLLTFKACILLLKSKINLEDHHNDEDANSLMCVSFRIRGKQNGLIVRYGSKQLQVPALNKDTEHLYIFKDSLSLNQDFPEAKEATSSELVFEFIVHDKTWKVKGCGVQLFVPLTVLLSEKKLKPKNVRT